MMAMQAVREVRRREWFGCERRKRTDPEAVPPRNRDTHIVRVDGRKMIADVGSGGRPPRQPLDLSVIGQAMDDRDALDEPLRIIEAGEYGAMVQRRVAGIWSNQFSVFAETLDRVFGIDPEPHRLTLMQIMEAHGCD